MSPAGRDAAGEHAPTGFFALRTPLLSFAELLAFGEGLAAPLVPLVPSAAPTAPGDLEAALRADRARLRERLAAVVTRPEVREALFLASPSLDERLEGWRRDPEGEGGQKVERILVRYLARMAARPTPFGLFAGCAVGTVGKRSDLAVGARGAVRRHSRLDMDFLFALAEAAVRLPGLREGIAYRPNDSLHRAPGAASAGGPGHVRLAAARVDGKARSYHLVSVEPTDYLDATLERARGGATLADLAAALASGDVSREDADAYVVELVESQILVPDLAPAVTGPEPLAALAAELGRHPETRDAGERLTAAGAALAALDEAGLGVAPERYRAIAEGLSGLPAPADLPRLFQVDLVKPGGAVIGPEIVREIVRGVAVLGRLASGHERLRGLTDAFTRRYGDQEVPLLAALDEESGIGFEASQGAGAFAEPLVEGLPFSSGGDEGDARWGAREKLLLRRLDEARRIHGRTVALSDEDLDVLATRAPRPLADAVAVMAQVAAAGPEALARGEVSILLQGVSGPSGANLLGRFCHADPDLAAWVARHLRAEEALAPGAVLAEIVHLPEGRLGNVLLRPVLRDHEIPFLGRSGAPAARQIPVADLTLRVVDDRLVLRSRRLDREVLPRLSTAHNHGAPRNLGVYRFLCALAHRDVVSGARFDWGALEAAPFLPRVTLGRLVLARARWRLGRADLEALGKARGAACWQAVQRLRADLDLPRWVAVADADNELPVDLDNVLSVESMVHLLKDRAEARLVEIFPGPEALCAVGPEGPYTHEIVVPLVRRAPLPARGTPSALPAPHRAERLFPPGSEWLYVKLYAGAATLDRVLAQVVAPVAARALASGAAGSWFFIRYADPERHLRVRFHGDPGRLLGEVYPDLLAAARPWLDADRVARVALDTYEREIDRYGGVEATALAERIFWADSEAVAEIVAPLVGRDDAADVRWRLALAGVDRLLGALGLDLAGKAAVITAARAASGRRFRAGPLLGRQIGERYRRDRGLLEPLLDPARDEESPLAPALAVLRRRTERVAPPAAALRALESAGGLTRPLADLAGSFVHMFTNRIFRGAALEQELVVYDLCGRLYDGLAARSTRALRAPRGS